MAIIQSRSDKRVDLFFSITLGEDASNLDDITKVKKGCLTKLINMLFKRHILINNDSKGFSQLYERPI